MENTGIDALYYLVIAQSILTILLMIVIVVCIFKIKNLYRKYDLFMRGKDAESMEEMIVRQIDSIEELKEQDRLNKDNMRIINKNMRASFQKFGVVKYNALKGIGGNLSFAIALLDYTNSGFVLNSIYSTEGCYLYMKEVDRGTTEIELGDEEREALEQALGYRQRES